MPNLKGLPADCCSVPLSSAEMCVIIALSGHALRRAHILALLFRTNSCLTRRSVCIRRVIRGLKTASPSRGLTRMRCIVVEGGLLLSACCV
jgi:hypothetical protein